MMNSSKQLLGALRDYLSRHSPGLTGALVGFGIALLWVLFGFFKMLFILLLTLIGAYVGLRWFSNREDIRNLFDKLFPPGMFR
jgi:uncharacterized membrane protein